MTNRELQAQITKYGKRIFAIGLNNNKTLMLDYKMQDEELIVSVSDITFETLADGTDVFFMPRVDKQSTSPVKFSMMHVTAFVEYIGVMDAEYATKRPQINGFK